MARKGRELEIIIAKIERGLNAITGNQVVIKSPDRVKDNVTGGFREVDGSIRYNVGSVPILITIECRDRNKVEDVTWIEQQITKKADIGASKTIAVSKIDFSKSARIKAKQGGIEVRTFKEIKEENLGWLKEIKIPNELLLQWRFTEVDLIADTDKQNLSLTIANDIHKDGVAFVRDKFTKKGLMLTDLGKMFVLNGEFPKHPGIEGFGEIIFPQESQFFVSTNQGDIRVLGIKLRVKIEKKVELEECLIKTFEYRSESRIFAKMIEINHNNFKLNIVKE